MTLTRNCKHCGDPIRGRSDKKFCNDFCRNSHHYLISPRTARQIRDINTALTKNRKILHTVWDQQPNQKRKRISFEKLTLMGFQFKYFTHSSSSKGKTSLFCYDYGYHATGKDRFTIVRDKEQ